METIRLRDSLPEDAPALAELARSLPQWFTPDVVEKVPADAARLPAIVAVNEHDAPVGLIVWKVEGTEAEIEWIMVAAEFHRRGLGRRLVADLIARLGGTGVTRLLVNTLASTIDYEPYARTRQFYEALGFHLEHIEPAGWPDGTDKATYVLTL